MEDKNVDSAKTTRSRPLRCAVSVRERCLVSTDRAWPFLVSTSCTLPHRLSLEHTSGLTWLAACQDVGAKMVCDNLNALAAYLATEQIIEPESPWRINRTLAFSHLRRLLPRVLAGRLRLTTRIVAELFSEIALNLQRFIPNRSRPRPVRPKPHLSHAYKFAP